MLLVYFIEVFTPWIKNSEPGNLDSNVIESQPCWDLEYATCLSHYVDRML